VDIKLGILSSRASFVVSIFVGNERHWLFALRIWSVSLLVFMVHLGILWRSGRGFCLPLLFCPLGMTVAATSFLTMQ
jgi:hypothetical protein